jgi:aminopeptidase-like protein
MRSKYSTYPEYHTSLDVLGKVVTSKGLNDSIKVYKKIILELENSIFPVTKIICEPKLSKRNLYPYINRNGNKNLGNDILNFLTYADGQNSLIDIFENIKVKKKKFNKILNILLKKKLINLNELPQKI